MKTEVGKNCRHLPVPWVQPDAPAPRDLAVCSQVNADTMQLRNLGSGCWEMSCVRKNCKKGGGCLPPCLEAAFKPLPLPLVSAKGPCPCLAKYPTDPDLTPTKGSSHWLDFPAWTCTCLTTTDLSGNPWTVGWPSLPPPDLLRSSSLGTTGLDLCQGNHSSAPASPWVTLGSWLTFSYRASCSCCSLPTSL